MPPWPEFEFPLPLKAEYGADALDIILDKDPLVEAIFFTTDTLALHALLECNRRGIKVPEQLAICGFGNYDLSGVVTPGLTTIQAPVHQMGAAAAERILARLSGETVPKKPLDLKIKLIRRGSA